MSNCPVRTVQTPVPNVGLLTIERIEPHGSLGTPADALGVGDALGAGTVWAIAGVTVAAPQANAATTFHLIRSHHRH
jgi:hypothetical protein